MSGNVNNDAIIIITIKNITTILKLLLIELIMKVRTGVIPI